MPTIDDPTRVFEQERARLIRLAYRMLGSLGEAEDVVQDAWLRWRHVDHPGVASAGAFLSSTGLSLQFATNHYNIRCNRSYNYVVS
ncbi:hypothetical protein FV219_05370 [Methylobacterium sp. WL122]|nr:hypothetical protein FV219_05370 [Methylobacterium sp. WL122]